MSSIAQYFLDHLNFNIAGTELVVEYIDSHGLFKMTISTLLKLSIVNWKHNRPPDMNRCLEIVQYYQSIKPNTRLDSTLHLNLNTTTNQFEVIDGIHRITALFEMHNTFESNNDPQKAKQYYWFYNTLVLVSIRKDYSDIALAELFYSLNKSVPIPSLYMESLPEQPLVIAQQEEEEEEPDNSIQEVNDYRRKIIENITTVWQTKYKDHFSTNIRCHKPNITLGDFQDILLEMWKIIIQYYSLEEMEVQMNRILERVNEHAKDANNTRETTKLKKSGRYIFTIPSNSIIAWTKEVCDRYN
jgi:hypothetical protein